MTILIFFLAAIVLCFVILIIYEIHGQRSEDILRFLPVPQTRYTRKTPQPGDPRSIAIYNEAITRHPRDATPYVQRGIAYRKLEEYEQALKDFNKAIALDHKNADAYIGRGSVYAGLGEEQKAFDDFSRAISIKPDHANIYHNRGLAYLGLGNVQRSLVDLTKSQELEPSEILHRWLLEWTRMIETRPDEHTAERLEQLAALDSLSVAAYNCKGVACWIRGNYDEALAALEQSIAEKPDQEDAHFWQGMAYASLGRDEKARAAIERALETPFPPLLLAPLRWFEQDRPDFYAAYVAPLLQEKL